MPYNAIHPSETTVANRKKRVLEEERLCITCRMYLCICLTVSLLLYVIVGVTIYLVEDFGYKEYNYFDGSS